jgi:putative PIN family toxin of toxin-antitoxin system
VIVTFDSGIYISAIKFKGIPEDALLFAIAMDELVICENIESEVIDVMRIKFRHDPAMTRILLDDLAKDATRVIITGKVTGVCRDAKDDFILECAETGNANLIVTGDKDLLSLKSFGNIQIVTPRQYLEIARK